MAGETVRTEAICMDIRPWSRTSHVVTWLAPEGRIVSVVKGAVRPKSPFLGQYDLNYTCEIVYYAHARGDLHVLRECAPVELRDGLRSDYRALALAGYFRRLVLDLAPSGPDCRAWYALLSRALSAPGRGVPALLRFELAVLRLSGLAPDFSGYDRRAEWSAFSVGAGSFGAAGGRCIRVARPTAEYLNRPDAAPVSPQIPLDAARVIGVFYQFHVDCASDVRRTVLGMIAKTNNKG